MIMETELKEKLKNSINGLVEIKLNSGDAMKGKLMSFYDSYNGSVVIELYGHYPMRICSRRITNIKNPL